MINTKIDCIQELTTPDALIKQLPIDDHLAEFIKTTRENIENILDKQTNRFIVIIGPCSIHNYQEALDYAEFIKKMRIRYNDKMEIVMRTYFSKPRTTIGWKGLIYDPDLNNTFDIEKGLVLARKLLIDILKLEVPCSMEHLDTISPQYFDDLLSWAAIGARTSESQVHRELASGVSTPIGFKNGTGGSLLLAVNGIEACSKSHRFMGCNKDGKISIVKTKGNKYGHVILRGSQDGPNYHKETVDQLRSLLQQKNLPENVIIDFSHGNSNKQHKKQLEVCDDICKQIKAGDSIIKGVMIESNIIQGRQDILSVPLRYGQSVTDACIDLFDSEIILEKLYRVL